MHDLFSLKHCICVHTDMINALMGHCALGHTRNEFLCPIAIKQADLFQYLALTVKMLASWILSGKLPSRAVVLKC